MSEDLLVNMTDKSLASGSFTSVGKQRKSRNVIPGSDRAVKKVKRDKG